MAGKTQTGSRSRQIQQRCAARFESQADHVRLALSFTPSLILNLNRCVRRAKSRSARQLLAQWSPMRDQGTVGLPWS